MKKWQFENVRNQLPFEAFTSIKTFGRVTSTMNPFVKEKRTMIAWKLG